MGIKEVVMIQIGMKYRVLSLEEAYESIGVKVIMSNGEVVFDIGGHKISPRDTGIFGSIIIVRFKSVSGNYVESLEGKVIPIALLRPVITTGSVVALKSLFTMIRDYKHYVDSDGDIIISLPPCCDGEIREFVLSESRARFLGHDWVVEAMGYTANTFGVKVRDEDGDCVMFPQEFVVGF
jgi:hypothetical protein